MAKKGNEMTFSNMMDILSNISKKTSITIENDGKKRTFIDTGIHILNALLSKSIIHGGVSKNRITIFAGPTGVGKSYICYNVARNAQKEGYKVIFIDTEYSTELADFENFGVNTSDNFVLLRSNKVEDIKIFLTKLLDDLKEKKDKGIDTGKIIIFLDSIGQLASRKEIEDALEGSTKSDMSRAKAIKSLFRIISSDLGYLDIPLVATNHIYMCVAGDTGIMMGDGSVQKIENVKIGDLVKTLEGDKEIEDKFEYDNSPVMEITLEDGGIIKCTPNHKFLIKNEWSSDENNECWKFAEDLKEDDIILKIIEEE